MLWRKSCPRCRGDLVMESDFYGQYVSCIQCGNILGERQGRSLLDRSTVEILRPSSGGVRRVVPENADAPAG